MQGFITFALIFGFILPCLCTRSNVGTKNTIYNVMQYGALGDGKTDDSSVYVFINFFFFIILINIYNFYDKLFSSII